MAITISTAMPTTFKVELLKGLHDLSNGADTLKIALLKSQAAGSGTYGAATTNYSTVTGNSDETSGSGYSAGGNTLTNVTPVADSTTAICDFSDTTWSSASFTTCGAVIYNTNNSNSACAVLSFGGDQTVSSGDFQIQFPAAAAATAIIRIA
tara:strand:- start:186 stop:641 length:456 start_codon:yes stop_codon:yes gene_type:complete